MRMRAAGGAIEGRQQREERALAGAGCPDEGGRRAGGRSEGDLTQHGDTRHILEADLLELHLAAERWHGDAAGVLLILGGEVEQFADPIEARKCLRHLGPHLRDLDQRGRDESRKEDVHAEVAQRERAGPQCIATQQDHDHCDGTDHHRRQRTDQRPPRDRDGAAPKDAVDAPREDEVLTPLGDVGLDDADPAEGFGQPAGDLGALPIAFAEDGPQPGEGNGQGRPEDRQHDHDHGGDLPADVDQHRQGGSGGEEAAQELDEAGADQIAESIGIRHDPGHQHADLRRIELPDRQSQYVRFDPSAHVGDGTLGGDAEHLRECEAGARLNQRGQRHDASKREEQVVLTGDDHMVDQVFRRRRQDQPGAPTDQHEEHAGAEPGAMLPQQVA